MKWIACESETTFSSSLQSQKNMKETIWRAKRLTREMQSYWKRYDRVERETRKRLEKEAEEQRKMDVEIIEVSGNLVYFGLQRFTVTSSVCLIRPKDSSES